MSVVAESRASPAAAAAISSNKEEIFFVFVSGEGTNRAAAIA
jgi:hypothetical protein